MNNRNLTTHKPWIRIIAAVVVCTFAVNDLVWANPDILSRTSRQAALQPPDIITSPSIEGAIKLMAKDLLESIPNLTTELTRKKHHLWRELDIKGVRIVPHLYTDPSKIENGILNANCVVLSQGYDVRIDLRDRSVDVKKQNKVYDNDGPIEPLSVPYDQWSPDLGRLVPERVKPMPGSERAEEVIKRCLEYLGEVYYPCAGVDADSLIMLLNTFPKAKRFVFNDAFVKEDNIIDVPEPHDIRAVMNHIVNNFRPLVVDLGAITAQVVDLKHVKITISIDDPAAQRALKRDSIEILYRVGDYRNETDAYEMIYVQRPGLSGRLSENKAFWSNLTGRLKSDGYILVSPVCTRSPNVRDLRSVAKIRPSSSFNYFAAINEWEIFEKAKNLESAQKISIDALLDKIPPAAESRIKCAVFDYGMVIGSFDYRHAAAALSKLTGVNEEKAYQMFEDRLNPGNAMYDFEHEKADPQVSIERLSQGINEWLAREFGPSPYQLKTEELLDVMNAIWLPENKEALDLIKVLRDKGYKVRILSVGNWIHYPYIKEHSQLKSLLEDIEKDYDVSCREETTKPEPSAYLRVAAKAGVEPSQAIFVDDTATNVAAAEAVGMAGCQFDPNDPAGSVEDIVGLLANAANPPKPGAPNMAIDRPRAEEGMTKTYIFKLGDRITIGQDDRRVTIDIDIFRRRVSNFTGKECWYSGFRVTAPVYMHIVRDEIDDGLIQDEDVGKGRSGRGSLLITRWTDVEKRNGFRIGNIFIKVLPESTPERILLRITDLAFRPVLRKPGATVLRQAQDGASPKPGAPNMAARKDEASPYTGIRPALIKDAARIRELSGLIWRGPNFRRNIEYYESAIRGTEYIGDGALARVWVYCDADGEVQGYIYVTFKDGYVYIQEMAVAKDHQKRGIGTALLALVIQEMVKLGCRRFFSRFNSDSANIAKGLGFSFPVEGSEYGYLDKDGVWPKPFGSAQGKPGAPNMAAKKTGEELEAKIDAIRANLRDFGIEENHFTRKILTQAYLASKRAFPEKYDVVFGAALDLAEHLTADGIAPCQTVSRGLPFALAFSEKDHEVALRNINALADFVYELANEDINKLVPPGKMIVKTADMRFRNELVYKMLLDIFKALENIARLAKDPSEFPKALRLSRDIADSFRLAQKGSADLSIPSYLDRFLPQATDLDSLEAAINTAQGKPGAPNMAAKKEKARTYLNVGMRATLLSLISAGFLAFLSACRSGQAQAWDYEGEARMFKIVGLFIVGSIVLMCVVVLAIKFYSFILKKFYPVRFWIQELKRSGSNTVESQRTAAIIALNELKKLHDPRAIEFIITYLRDEYRELRMAAREALEELRVDPGTLKRGYLAALSSPDKYARDEASRAIKESGDEFNLLLESLRSPDKDVRIGAINALKKLNDEKAIGPLFEFLLDGDKEIRRNAHSAIVVLCNASTTDLLLKKLEDPNKLVRRTAAIGLAKLRDERALDVLIFLLKDKDEEVIDAIAMVGGQRAIDAVDAFYLSLTSEEVFGVVHDNPGTCPDAQTASSSPPAPYANAACDALRRMKSVDIDPAIMKVLAGLGFTLTHEEDVFLAEIYSRDRDRFDLIVKHLKDISALIATYDKGIADPEKLVLEKIFIPLSERIADNRSFDECLTAFYETIEAMGSGKIPIVYYIPSAIPNMISHLKNPLAIKMSLDFGNKLACKGLSNCDAVEIGAVGVLEQELLFTESKRSEMLEALFEFEASWTVRANVPWDSNESLHRAHRKLLYNLPAVLFKTENKGEVAAVLGEVFARVKPSPAGLDVDEAAQYLQDETAVSKTIGSLRMPKPGAPNMAAKKEELYKGRIPLESIKEEEESMRRAMSPIEVRRICVDNKWNLSLIKEEILSRLRKRGAVFSIQRPDYPGLINLFRILMAKGILVKEITKVYKKFAKEPFRMVKTARHFGINRKNEASFCQYCQSLNIMDNLRKMHEEAMQKDSRYRLKMEKETRAREAGERARAMRQLRKQEKERIEIKQKRAAEGAAKQAQDFDAKARKSSRFENAIRDMVVDRSRPVQHAEYRITEIAGPDKKDEAIKALRRIAAEELAKTRPLRDEQILMAIGYALHGLGVAAEDIRKIVREPEKPPKPGAPNMAKKRSVVVSPQVHDLLKNGELVIKASDDQLFILRFRTEREAEDKTLLILDVFAMESGVEKLVGYAHGMLIETASGDWEKFVLMRVAVAHNRLADMPLSPAIMVDQLYRAKYTGIGKTMMSLLMQVGQSMKAHRLAVEEVYENSVEFYSGLGMHRTSPRRDEGSSFDLSLMPEHGYKFPLLRIVRREAGKPDLGDEAGKPDAANMAKKRGGARMRVSHLGEGRQYLKDVVRNSRTNLAVNKDLEDLPEILRTMAKLYNPFNVVYLKIHAPMEAPSKIYLINAHDGKEQDHGLQFVHKETYYDLLAVLLRKLEGRKSGEIATRYKNLNVHVEINPAGDILLKDVLPDDQPDATNISVKRPAKKEQDTFSKGDYTNPFIERHIDEGRAIEVYEKEGKIVTIRRDRTNPRAPPLEGIYQDSGAFEKIRKAKSPELLRGILNKKRNFRNLSPDEREKLIEIVQSLPLSIILGHSLIGETKDEYILLHVRTGYSRATHRLKPTIWIGEKLFEQLAAEELGQVLLEESQHILKPFEMLPDGTWIHFDGEIDEYPDHPDWNIEHDRSLIDSLLERAQKAHALTMSSARPALLARASGAPNMSANKDDRLKPRRARKLTPGQLAAIVLDENSARADRVDALDKMGEMIRTDSLERLAALSLFEKIIASDKSTPELRASAFESLRSASWSTIVAIEPLKNSILSERTTFLQKISGCDTLIEVFMRNGASNALEALISVLSSHRAEEIVKTHILDSLGRSLYGMDKDVPIFEMMHRIIIDEDNGFIVRDKARSLLRTAAETWNMPSAILALEKLNAGMMPNESRMLPRPDRKPDSGQGLGFGPKLSIFLAALGLTILSSCSGKGNSSEARSLLDGAAGFFKDHYIGLMMAAVAGVIGVFAYLMKRISDMRKKLESFESLVNDMKKEQLAGNGQSTTKFTAMEPLDENRNWPEIKSYMSSCSIEEQLSGKKGLQLRGACEQWAKEMASTLALSDSFDAVRENSCYLSGGRRANKHLLDHFWVEVKLKGDDRWYVLDRTVGQFADIRVLELLGGAGKLGAILNNYFIKKYFIIGENDLAAKLKEYDSSGGFFGPKEDYPFLGTEDGEQGPVCEDIKEEWSFVRFADGVIRARAKFYRGDELLAEVPADIRPEGIVVYSCAIYRNEPLIESYGTIRLMRRFFTRAAEISRAASIEPHSAFVFAISKDPEISASVRKIDIVLTHLGFERGLKVSAAKSEADDPVEHLANLTTTWSAGSKWHLYWHMPLSRLVNTSQKKLAESGYIPHDPTIWDTIFNDLAVAPSSAHRPEDKPLDGILGKPGAPNMAAKKEEAISRAEIEAVIDEINTRHKQVFDKDARDIVAAKLSALKLIKGKRVLVVGPGAADYLSIVLARLGLKVSIIEPDDGARGCQEDLFGVFGIDNIDVFASYGEIKVKGFDYVFMLGVLHQALSSIADPNLSEAARMIREDKDGVRSKEMRRLVEDYCEAKATEMMAPIIGCLDPDGGILFINSLAPYQIKNVTDEYFISHTGRMGMHYLPRALERLGAELGLEFMPKPQLDLNDFTVNAAYISEMSKGERVGAAYELRRRPANDDADKQAGTNLALMPLDILLISIGAAAILAYNVWIFFKIVRAKARLIDCLDNNMLSQLEYVEGKDSLSVVSGLRVFGHKNKDGTINTTIRWRRSGPPVLCLPAVLVYGLWESFTGLFAKPAPRIDVSEDNVGQDPSAPEVAPEPAGGTSSIGLRAKVMDDEKSRRIGEAAIKELESRFGQGDATYRGDHSYGTRRYSCAQWYRLEESRPTPEQIQLRESIYFERIGYLFLLHKDAYAVLSEALKKELGSNVILVDDFDGTVFTGAGLANHTRTTIIAMMNAAIEGRRVIDAGSAEGFLSLAALKLGAASVDPVEIKNELVERAGKLFRLNGFVEGKDYRLHCEDLKNTDKLAAQIPDSAEETVVISNIGTWPKLYSVDNSNTMELAAKITNAKLYIGGGYYWTEDPKMLPFAATMAIDADKEKISQRGFAVEPEYALTDTGMAKIYAFIAKRRTDGQAPAISNDAEPSSVQASQPTVLLDVRTDDQLAQCLKGEMISFASSKIVLAFDSSIGRYQDQQPLRRVIAALNALKENPNYENILANLTILTGPAAELSVKLQQYVGKKDAKVFVFAPDSDETRAQFRGIEAAINAVYIDESGFNLKSRSYYPLTQIVVIALAQYFDKMVSDGEIRKSLKIEGKDCELSEVNIESIENSGGSLIVKLLPTAAEHNTQELIKRYATIIQFLSAA